MSDYQDTREIRKIWKTLTPSKEGKKRDEKEKIDDLGWIEST